MLQAKEIFLFVLLGVYARAVAPWRKREVENYWASMIAFVAAFFIFHALLYHAVAELRYYVMIAPAMLMLVMAGLKFLLDARFLRGFAPALRTGAVIVCVGACFAAWTFTIPPRPAHGFENIAKKLVSTPASEVLLISSSGYGEGMFIAEVAQHEPRPSHIVLRAAQQLAHTSWTGEDYSMRFQTPEQVEQVLEEIPVSIVVVNTVRPPLLTFAHHQLLIDTLRKYTSAWEQIDSYPAAACAQAAEEIQVYRFRNRKSQQPHRITVDLTNKINKVLTGQF